MKKAGILLLTVITAMLVIGFAYAAEPGGATVTDSDLGEFAAPAAGSANVEAGNITAANLDTNQSTFRWVGLLGNVSGNIVLGDAGSNTLFTWVASGNLVYASAGTPDWSLLNDGDEAEIVAIDTWLTGSAADNYTNTFTEASEPIGSNLFTISSDFAYTTNATGDNVWKTYSLEDGANTVYAGQVIEDGNSFDNSTADYQMIIPEDGTSGNTAATAYNLWVELV